MGIAIRRGRALGVNEGGMELEEALEDDLGVDERLTNEIIPGADGRMKWEKMGTQTDTSK